MQEAGVPAVLIATEAFVPLAAAHARTLTAREIPTVAIEHPLGGIDRSTVRRRAAAALSTLVDLLGGPA